VAYIEIVRLPISVSDIRDIEQMLRAEAPLCTSFSHKDVYSIALYHEQFSIHGTGVKMLVDRNVFARVVALAKGATAKQDHRMAAAIMAFAQCAGIDIEPNLALYEGVASQDESPATGDLALFRAADNLHPLEFANIALGRVSTLLGPLVCEPLAEALPDLSLRLRQYSFVYPLVLKLGCIELQGGPVAQRMRRFLDWTYENWYFSAPVIAFAATLFSGSPPRRSLKNLRHPDRALALKGLRNCAWDLTYITWWSQLLKRQDKENRLYLLCSRDRTLRSVAQQILARPEMTDADEEKLLCGLLGGLVYDHYAGLKIRMHSSDRLINQAGIDVVSHRKRIVAALEDTLRKPMSRVRFAT
jgi:hypothetical protein